MAYEVNKSDGEVLVNLVDGEVDNTSTSLNLLGKNYLGYGELIAENFVHMLENFASTTPPGDEEVLTGQLWFNTGENRLAVRDGDTQWKTLAHLVSKSTKPVDVARLGDFWWDSTNKALKIYTGDLTLPGSNTGWVTASAFQGGSGISFASLLDIETPPVSHSVVRLNVNGTCVAIISVDAEFTIAASHAIPGFNVIGKGINMNTTGNDSTAFNPNAFKLRGISMEAEFADVAEIYVGDATYEPGTVVSLGGEAEVTQTTSFADQNVFGIVSSRPAYLMNARRKHDKNAMPIAVAGRIPVKVKGNVTRGDRLVASDLPGVAQSASIDAPGWSIIGRSLGNFSGEGIGKVEATVGVR
jgi:hypothetical protein